PISNGWRGDIVKLIQVKVGANPVDGVFGSVTHKAIVNWQHNNRLRQDGIVGPITWAKMFG
ncbi:MAG: peptidoglycan-binding domain-containing protein, partial [Opitutae bacterium]